MSAVVLVLRRWCLIVLLIAFAAGIVAGGVSPTLAQDNREQELQAARALFERNLDSIRNKDRDAYLATYWQSDRLARNGAGGVSLGYADHAAGASDNNWPDVFDAQQLQLVWLREGVVYGSYRYRVAYGTTEIRGISERVFLNTEDGWRIAVTSAFGAPEGTPPPPRALVGATLWTGLDTETIENAHVIVRSGRIDCAGSAADCPLPEGVATVDMTGRWIMPGLIDTAVHLSQSAWLDTRPDLIDVSDEHALTTALSRVQDTAPQRLRDHLHGGVTSVLDAGGFPWTWDLRTPGDSQGARLAASGPLVTARAVLPDQPASRQSLVVDDAASARRAVDYLASRNTDAVVFQWDATAPGNTSARRDAQPGTAKQADVLQSVADNAERLALPLVVDTPALEGAIAAVASGATVIRGVGDGMLETELLQKMRDNDIAYSAGLVTVANEARCVEAALNVRTSPHDDPFGVTDSLTAAWIDQTPDISLTGEQITALRRRSGMLRMYVGRRRANLQAAHEAGVRLVVGSGSGTPFNVHGAALIVELEAMQASGLTPVDILRAATTNAARVLPAFADRGTVEKDKRADLLILEADPTASVSALRSPVAVMRGGELRWSHERTSDDR